MLPSRILDSTRAVILSEGIYDLDSLLQSSPKYREWFIEPTFGSDSYSKFSILNSRLRRSAGFSWLLIHSMGDSLVDALQTTEMHNHLKNLQAGVTISLYDLVDEHDAILETEKYINLVKNFVTPKRSGI